MSGPAADATAPLGPFLMRAAREIAERLLEGARAAEKQLLLEFQAHAHHQHPVVVIGESMVLTNNAAVDLLQGADHGTFRSIAADSSNHSAHEGVIVLSSGAEVTVRTRLVAGNRGGAMFEVLGTIQQTGPQTTTLEARLSAAPATAPAAPTPNAIAVTPP